MFNPQFWHNKKVFITGHTGFKGSWLSLWLQSLGAQLTGYALNPPTDPSLFELAKVSDGMESIIGDVRDLDHLTKSIKDAQPEIVIHLAAQPLVRESYKNPVETYAINVMGTVNLLEACRLTDSVRAVVNVTTDKCYENKEWNWGYREIDRMGGYDPYSNSKSCSELVTESYRNSFFNQDQYHVHQVALASARAGNVIGGGDWAADRLIPDCIRSLLKDEKVTVRNPQAIRPWQHVLEPLCGYLMLAQGLYEQRPKFAQGWNFGPEDADAKPVQWIVQQLCLKLDKPELLELDQSPQPHEANYLKLDCSKAKVELGWRPIWNLDRALDKVVEWARGYADGQDVRAICLNQIKEYSDDEV